MEDLAPSYNFVLYWQGELASSASVRTLVDQYIKESELRAFEKLLQNWLLNHLTTSCSDFCLKNRIISPFQRVIFDLLYQSLQGRSVFEAVCSLELEMRNASLVELDTHLAKLPYKLMIPLLLFQFPALLLLILGPLIFYFLKEVS